MIKRVLAIFTLTLLFLFSSPVYSLDTSSKTLEKYTKKISNKFTRTYCNTTKFGISYDGALAFAIGETNKEFKNAFCSVRPPGHHCNQNKAAGFCILNNVAIGAKYLINKSNLKVGQVVIFRHPIQDRIQIKRIKQIKENCIEVIGDNSNYSTIVNLSALFKMKK